MYWGVIDPEGGRSTNNILLQGRLKICDQFIDLLVYEPGASNHQTYYSSWSGTTLVDIKVEDTLIGFGGGMGRGLPLPSFL
jgi:hypothetical protein